MESVYEELGRELMTVTRCRTVRMREGRERTSGAVRGRKKKRQRDRMRDGWMDGLMDG